MPTSIRWFKEPVSAATHLFGFVLAVVGGTVLIGASVPGPQRIGMAVYSATLALLFWASTVFHFVDLGRRGNRWLQRLDHSAIYLLIAGSYVPPLLHMLTGTWRLSMLITVGVLAAAGVVLKLVWLECPGWLSTLTYLALGWIVLIPAPLILPQLPAWPLAWLVLGGLTYSLGALVYLFRWPDPWPKKMGHHELWHLFVLGGAAAHFVFTAWLLRIDIPPFG